MTNSKGLLIEERMRKFFKGKTTNKEEIDFETTNYLYEVKSCKLFNNCNNNNHLKKDCKWKKTHTTQLGRFRIKTNNHILLYLQSLKTNKQAKYVFVIHAAGQIIYKTIPWKNVKIPNNKDYHYIPINKVFKEGWKEQK